LRSGADDFNSVMLGENFAPGAGVVETCVTDDAMISLLHNVGRLPARRDTSCRLLETVSPGENGFDGRSVAQWQRVTRAPVPRGSHPTPRIRIRVVVAR
jgi:hypothetical protein